MARWVTLKNGTRVFIEDGESVSDAFKRYKELKKQHNYTPLYHGTSYANMINILNTDTLIAQLSPKGDTEEAVSFARSIDNAYGRVAFELDRDALNHDYKITLKKTEVDPDEERVHKTISNVSKYVNRINWVDSPHKTYLKQLRRQLVNNFKNPEYTKTPGSSAYELRQIAIIANKKGIPVDANFKTALSYIDKFDRREFDMERYLQLKKKGRI